ncbi:hypothetical protein HNY73_001897 [Argiope bruennichi]|uniref:Uncharacterized protein n=1 Tax=Argiope bruennichi TaxID=94029 RepID=A0A8T0FYE1_ARGBR|nr:hypothetical protein HNY73_001897 [Argiope bruennichi]
MHEQECRVQAIDLVLKGGRRIESDGGEGDCVGGITFSFWSASDEKVENFEFGCLHQCVPSLVSMRYNSVQIVLSWRFSGYYSNSSIICLLALREASKKAKGPRNNKQESAQKETQHRRRLVGIPVKGVWPNGINK